MQELIFLSKDKNNEHTLEQREIYYLYPYLLRFCKKQNFELFNNVFLFETESLFLLKDLIKRALLELIEETYIKPSDKSISKHPTRYERFVINNEKFVVDYTTSVIGRLTYLLFLRFAFISDECNKTNGGIIVKIKKNDDFFW